MLHWGILRTQLIDQFAVWRQTDERADGQGSSERDTKWLSIMINHTTLNRIWKKLLKPPSRLTSHLVGYEDSNYFMGDISEVPGNLQTEVRYDSKETVIPLDSEETSIFGSGGIWTQHSSMVLHPCHYPTSQDLFEQLSYTCVHA